MSAPRVGNGGRPPGLPKTGGRVKGTPNRATVALREKLAALGCDPVAELVGIAKDPKTETGFKVNIYTLLLRHTNSVPRPIDDTNVGDATTNGAMMAPEEALSLAKYVIEVLGPNSAPQGEKTPQTDGKTDLPDRERGGR